MTGRPQVERIVFHGVRHWCRNLIEVVDAACADAPAMSVFEPRRPRTAWSRRTVAVRVGYRPGARTWRGAVFDAVWSLTTRPGSRRTYWIGTDVSRALAPGATRRPSVVRWLAGRSGCGAPWFVDELRTIGLEASDVRFPYRSAMSEQPASWPGRFTVGAYVPEVNAEHYGVATLAALVHRFPDVEFRFFGGGSVCEADNVTYLGWIDDVAGELDAVVVHLRLSAHDAIAGTVRDALSCGRYVVFGYPLPGVSYASHDDVAAIAQHIEEFAARYADGRLPPNDTGRAYVATLDWETDAQRFLAWIVGTSSGATP